MNNPFKKLIRDIKKLPDNKLIDLKFVLLKFEEAVKKIEKKNVKS